MIERKIRKTKTGTVTSNKMTKTITVTVERKVKHALYGKYFGVSKKYHAHDESDQIKIGDTVEISESRPMSRTKSWVVTRVVEESKGI